MGGTAETSGGTITVREARGPAQLSTSGGDIHIDAVYAGIHATTSGGNVEAAFPASPTADATLHTSGGNVTVRLPASASATVDLRTSGGHVKSDLPVTVQGEQKHSTLVGRIGDGGRLIKAGTSGGNVNLLRASAGSS